MFIPLSPNNWAVAASAMNSHTHPAASASNVVNSLWGMQITWFPPSQQYGSSQCHGGSTMRESDLKHICDSIFCPSAMRNPKRRGHVRRRPAARPRRSPQICTAVCLLDYKFHSFHHNVNSSTARARRPAPSRSVLLYSTSVQRACKDVQAQVWKEAPMMGSELIGTQRVTRRS